ncbi:MAG TPA: DJ-1/PfpI family protein, partial [Actinomycetota bacterium]|nr:DJ-1/PfpI family protein [Actinomycetota bacterium]
MEVGILVFNGADELDVVGPYRVFGAVNEMAAALNAPEMNLHLVAEALGSVQLGAGLVIMPTDVYITCPELDVLLVPGGSSSNPEFGRRAQQANHQTVDFVRARSEEAKLTSSVCTGAFILAEAGL